MESVELDRCAAYVAARAALGAIARAAGEWPAPLAELARAAASEALMATAESVAHEPVSAARRRRVRDALTAALQLAATCDIARASGLADGALDDAQRAAGRAIVALGMLFHANTLG
jgi:hypothetical protein